MVYHRDFHSGPWLDVVLAGANLDHNRLIFEANRDLPDIFHITSALGKGIFGAMVVGF